MNGRNLYELPEEVLITVFQYCDAMSIGRLARTCKKFNYIISSEDTVWKTYSDGLLGSNMAKPAMQMRCKPILSHKDRCKIAKRWDRSYGRSFDIAVYRKCMPWTHLERDYVYFSRGRRLIQYKRGVTGKVCVRNTVETVPFVEDDISKFSVTEDEVVCAGRNGKIKRLVKHSFQPICSFVGHTSEVLTVAAKKNVIISGGKDYSVKIWRNNGHKTVCQKEIRFKNRVLSTSILPYSRLFVVGTCGAKYIHPLQMFTIDRGTLLSRFGGDYQNGAGVLDIYPETYHTFLTCGYDTNVRLWDIRTPMKCSSTWTEPYDTGLYCVRSDHNVTIMTGSSSDGKFQVWDRRVTTLPVKVYHIPLWGIANSLQLGSAGYLKGSVYSIEFDAAHMFVAFENIFLQFSYI